MTTVDTESLVLKPFLDALEKRGLDGKRVTMHKETSAFLYDGVSVAPYLFLDHMVQMKGLEVTVDHFVKTAISAWSQVFGETFRDIQKDLSLREEWEPSSWSPGQAPPTDVSIFPDNLLILIDFETNGYRPDDDVLCVAALRVLFQNGKFLFDGDYVRYYYPKKRYNPEALAVNGLSEEVITRERAGHGTDWYAYYDEDIDFPSFIEGADLFIGHNVSFDQRFLPEKPLKEKTFCTMRPNAPIVKIPKSSGGWKNPTLTEAAKHYDLDIQADNLHKAKYDVYLCFMIFKKMFEEGNKEIEKKLSQKRR